MTHRLRTVGLDFTETAPVRLVFTQQAAASPEAVFRALSDVPAWPQWYGPVTAARPSEDGATREIRLRGGTRFAETIVAADPAERYAYRVEETNAPGVRALLEEWRLSPAATGSGTVVRYTMAADGTAVFRCALRLMGPGMARAFRSAVRTLDGRLSRTEHP